MNKNQSISCLDFIRMPQDDSTTVIPYAESQLYSDMNYITPNTMSIKRRSMFSLKRPRLSANGQDIEDEFQYEPEHKKQRIHANLIPSEFSMPTTQVNSSSEFDPNRAKTHDKPLPYNAVGVKVTNISSGHTTIYQSVRRAGEALGINPGTVSRALNFKVGAKGSTNVTMGYEFTHPTVEEYEMRWGAKNTEPSTATRVSATPRLRRGPGGKFYNGLDGYNHYGQMEHLPYQQQMPSENSASAAAAMLQMAALYNAANQHNPNAAAAMAVAAQQQRAAAAAVVAAASQAAAGHQTNMAVAVAALQQAAAQQQNGYVNPFAMQAVAALNSSYCIQQAISAQQSQAAFAVAAAARQVAAAQANTHLNVPHFSSEMCQKVDLRGSSHAAEAVDNDTRGSSPPMMHVKGNNSLELAPNTVGLTAGSRRTGVTSTRGWDSTDSPTVSRPASSNHQIQHHHHHTITLDIGSDGDLFGNESLSRLHNNHLHHIQHLHNTSFSDECRPWNDTTTDPANLSVPAAGGNSLVCNRIISNRIEGALPGRFTSMFDSGSSSGASNRSQSDSPWRKVMASPSKVHDRSGIGLVGRVQSGATVRTVSTGSGCIASSNHSTSSTLPDSSDSPTGLYNAFPSCSSSSRRRHQELANAASMGVQESPSSTHISLHSMTENNKSAQLSGQKTMKGLKDDIGLDDSKANMVCNNLDSNIINNMMRLKSNDIHTKVDIHVNTRKCITTSNGNHNSNIESSTTSSSSNHTAACSSRFLKDEHHSSTENLIVPVVSITSPSNATSMNTHQDLHLHQSHLSHQHHNISSMSLSPPRHHQSSSVSTQNGNHIHHLSLPLFNSGVSCFGSAIQGALSSPSMAHTVSSRRHLHNQGQNDNNHGCEAIPTSFLWGN